MSDANVFYEELHTLEHLPQVKDLRRYSQHRGNTTFGHVRHVALSSFRLSQRLHLNVDEKSLARGAMLHDYYLYSTKDVDISAYRHGTGHPVTALKNAQKIFDLNAKEENIILSHMWPLTITRLPRSKEAWLVCLTDKYCALSEMLGFRGKLPEEAEAPDRHEK